MSKFHTTVSRRDFMKAMGLGAAGLGVAGAASNAVIPAFHDLDELASSAYANYKQPWYVKEKELKNPSAEVDWSIFEHWDSGSDPGGRSGAIVGYAPRNAQEVHDLEYRAEATIKQGALQDQWTAAGLAGTRVQDRALKAGAGAHRNRSLPWDGTSVSRPEVKWTGTPEEATNLVRAAFHFLGIPKIGVMEVDSDTKKLWPPSKARFEDTPVGYEDDKVKVIPNSARYTIAYAVRQPVEITKMSGINPARMGSSVGYANESILQIRLTAFLKALGYQAYVADRSRGPMNVALGALTGIGELGRHAHQITHEWGSAGLRLSPGIATDLPMAPTNPIDAGMHRFCKTCKICAEICTENNGESPLSHETEPSWEVKGPSNRVGVKAFQIAWGRCIFCPYCMAACPWSSHGMSLTHDLVKIVSANTGIFNSFFTTMEHTFGYGLHNKPEHWEAWWSRDLNTWPHDNIWGTG